MARQKMYGLCLHQIFKIKDFGDKVVYKSPPMVIKSIRCAHGIALNYAIVILSKDIISMISLIYNVLYFADRIRCQAWKKWKRIRGSR